MDLRAAALRWRVGNLVCVGSSGIGVTCAAFRTSVVAGLAGVPDKRAAAIRGIIGAAAFDSEAGIADRTPSARTHCGESAHTHKCQKGCHDGKFRRADAAFTPPEAIQLSEKEICDNGLYARA